MAPKAAIALFVSLNLLFFSMANANIVTLTQCGDLDLSICVNVLGGCPCANVVGECPCCTFIKGLVDLNMQACLCAMVKANMFGLITVDATALLYLRLDECNIPHPIPAYDCSAY